MNDKDKQHFWKMLKDSDYAVMHPVYKEITRSVKQVESEDRKAAGKAMLDLKKLLDKIDDNNDT